MRVRLLIPACSSLILFAVAVATPAARAQDIFVTPIPNVPFSAVVSVERSATQPDGTNVSFHTVREIARDNHGRIHNEARVFEPASDSSIPAVVRVHLYDPQTRTNTMIVPMQRVYWTETLNHPPSTVPPSPRYGSGAQQGLPQNDFTQVEDLGVREFSGVSAHGYRETQTIPSENGEPETTVTDEYWYSDELRINLMMKHSDPRKGTVTLTVSRINRTEPDPSAFEVPDGYKLATAVQRAN